MAYKYTVPVPIAIMATAIYTIIHRLRKFDPVGVVENLSEGYIGRGMKEIAGFVLILVVLMVRPYGLFGKPDIERV